MAKRINLSLSEITDSGDNSVYYNENKPNAGFLNCTDEHNILLFPLENEVFFPYMKIGSTTDNRNRMSTLMKAYKEKEPVFFFLESDIMSDDSELVQLEDILHSRGVVGYIIDINTDGDGQMHYAAIIGPRAVAVNLNRRTPYMRGDIVYDIADRIVYDEVEAEYANRLEAAYEEITKHLQEEDNKRLHEILDTMPINSEKRFYFMCQNSPVITDERYRILEEPTLSRQRRILVQVLEREVMELGIRTELHSKTLGEIGQRQREEFLRTQMQQIKAELGEGFDADEEELRLRAKNKEWSEEAGKRFEKELKKLQRFNPTSPDYAIQYAYLDEYLDLPWNHCDNSEFSLEEVEEILERDHYGLEKVKERIIEQMAVLKLRKDTKSPILCLYGPPGVGKTSLGKSIADALGRKYVRVALGGLHDEAEIRGHRRTYLGSMPGRIINALKKCGTSDPVMVLDEIDKIGADYKGDPAQALLEVLDPEQNCKFHDNYIDQDYDLSKVLFIATANTLSTISSPLLDRMEMIEIGGYVEAEKIKIAQKHLIGKSLVEHGFAPDEISFSDESIKEIINSYTRESGVRRLEKKINDVLRKEARLKASGKKIHKLIDIDTVKDFLGKPDVFNDVYENNDIPGIVTGLAWTQSGGEILFIESSIAPGKEGKLVLTGNLGDVMKESAMLALQYIKANSEKLNLKEEQLQFGTIHIHVPEGAVPKDGPSAGVTIVTSLASTFTGRKVRSHLAMTGEITLRGKVLPVGGVKEKILAAKRAGIKTILLSEKNRKDIEEIKPEYISGLQFQYVDTIDQVLDFALL